MSTGDPRRVAPTTTDKLVWICTRCDRKLTDNPRQCPHCGYTVYKPTWEKPEPVGSTPVSEEPARPPNREEAARSLVRLVKRSTGVIIKDEVAAQIIRSVVEPAYARGISKGRRQTAEEIIEKVDARFSVYAKVEAVAEFAREIAERGAPMPDQPTPDQVASFDQTHAAWSASLDTAIAMFAAELADGENREIAMAGLSMWLSATMDPGALAEHLAVAVSRLVGPWEPAEQPEGSDRG